MSSRPVKGASHREGRNSCRLAAGKWKRGDDKPMTEILCDGCGIPATPEHIARRLRHLELATRFRPIHIGILFVAEAPPPRLENYFYYCVPDRSENDSQRTGSSSILFDRLLQCGDPGAICCKLDRGIVQGRGASKGRMRGACPSLHDQLSGSGGACWYSHSVVWPYFSTPSHTLTLQRAPKTSPRSAALRDVDKKGPASE